MAKMNKPGAANTLDPHQDRAGGGVYTRFRSSSKKGSTRPVLKSRYTNPFKRLRGDMNPQTVPSIDLPQQTAGMSPEEKQKAALVMQKKLKSNRRTRLWDKIRMSQQRDPTLIQDAEQKPYNAFTRFAPRVSLSTEEIQKTYAIKSDEECRKTFNTKEDPYKSVVTDSKLDEGEIQTANDRLFANFNLMIKLSLQDKEAPEDPKKPRKVDSSAKLQARLTAFSKTFDKEFLKELDAEHARQRRALDANKDLSKDAKQNARERLEKIHEEQRSALTQRASEHKSRLHNVVAGIRHDYRNIAKQEFLDKIPKSQKQEIMQEILQNKMKDDPNKPLEVGQLEEISPDDFLEAVKGKELNMMNSKQLFSFASSADGGREFYSKNSHQWGKWNDSPSYYEKDIAKAADDFVTGILLAGMMPVEITAANEVFLQHVASKLLDAGYPPEAVTIVKNSKLTGNIPARNMSECGDNWAVEARERAYLRKEAGQTLDDLVNMGDDKSDNSKAYIKEYRERYKRGSTSGEHVVLDKGADTSPRSPGPGGG